MVDLSGLPGEELISKGMRDLACGETRTQEALLVAMAATKLESLGLGVDKAAYEIEEPELELYRLLGEYHQDAYREYKALRNRLGRFERALQSRITRALHVEHVA